MVEGEAEPKPEVFVAWLRRVRVRVRVRVRGGPLRLGAQHERLQAGLAVIHLWGV